MNSLMGNNVMLQAMSAMARGQNPREFLSNLAKNDPRLKGVDFNNLQQTAQNLCNQRGLNMNDEGYHMTDCCCQIKTMMLENRLQDNQIALQNAQNLAVNNAQSQYLLSQLGDFVPKTAATAGA